MKRFPLFILFIFALGCTKKDIQIFKHHQQKNRCSIVSVNADKQNTDDFFMIKTFDGNGLLTHIKTQVGNIYGDRYQFDYEVTYRQDKALFKGSTKAFTWVLDVPPQDPDSPVDPAAPKHPEEIIEYRDTKDFEILLDRRSHFPNEVKYVAGGESLLRLTYNNRGFLSKVASSIGNFFVETDYHGNILSILTAPLVEQEPYYGPQQLGIWYRYSDRKISGSNQYYETPTIFISPQFSLLELLDWGPLQPNRERIHVTLQHNFGEEYLPSPYMDMDYSNHQYDQNGKLIKYDFDGDVRRALPYTAPDFRHSSRSITWECGNRFEK